MLAPLALPPVRLRLLRLGLAGKARLAQRLGRLIAPLVASLRVLVVQGVSVVRGSVVTATAPDLLAQRAVVAPLPLVGLAADVVALLVHRPKLAPVTALMPHRPVRLVVHSLGRRGRSPASVATPLARARVLTRLAGLKRSRERHFAPPVLPQPLDLQLRVRRLALRRPVVLLLQARRCVHRVWALLRRQTDDSEATAVEERQVFVIRLLVRLHRPPRLLLVDRPRVLPLVVRPLRTRLVCPPQLAATQFTLP